MKKLIITLTLSISGFAQIPADTQFGCQSYTGESSVFEDLTKFSITKANQKGERRLEAHSASCTEVVDGELEFPYGNCRDEFKGISCTYINCSGKKISVFLDDSTVWNNEIEGKVSYKGFWRTKNHKVSCNLLTF